MLPKLALPAILGLLAAVAPVSAQENTLIVLVDDVGVDQLPCYGLGLDLPATPVIDAMAHRGVLFRNAYANPVCSPTRAQILTGRHSFRTGLGHIVGPGMSSPEFYSLQGEETTLPELLDLGTGGLWDHAAIGKWHLYHGLGYETAANDAGFDHFAGTPANLGFDPSGYYNWIKVVDGTAFLVTDTYATTDQVDDTLAFVNTAVEPWFCYLAFSAGHVPFHEPPASLHSQDLSSAGDPLSNPRPFYKATVEALDTELGRLFSGMGSMLDRTNVIFMADNGTPFEVVIPPFDPLHAKNTLYEGGCHVPMIVSGPSVAQLGSECDALVSATDVFATVAEFAGVDPLDVMPAGFLLDSISLVPYLKEPDGPSQREAVFSQLFGPLGTGPYNIEGYTIRDERYKLIRVFTSGLPGYPVEFYDLWNDPHEQSDLLAPGLSSAELDAYRRLDRISRDLVRAAEVTGPAGSEQHILLGVNTDGGGGVAVSTDYQVSSQVGHVAGGAAVSPSFSLSGGTTWLTGGINSDHPLVFGLSSARGSPEGGEVRKLFGLGLNELATTSVLELELGGVDIPGLVVVSDTEAHVTTPIGKGQYSNPAGAETFWLSTDFGQQVDTQAFAYLPALDALAPTNNGGTLEMRVATEPGDSYTIFWAPGGTITPLSIPPFSGQLELPLTCKMLTPLVRSVSGEDRLVFPIPLSPGSVGQTVDFQGLSGPLLDLASAGWTNCLRVVLGPEH